MQDIGKAFSFPFEDREWLQKLLIAGLVGIVPVLNFALIGYVLEVMEMVVQGRPAVLPDWSDLGAKWRRGLLPGLAILVYTIPVYVIAGAMYVPFFFAIFATSADSSAFAGILLAFYAAECVAGVVMLIYYIALALLAPFLAGMYLESGTFKSLFRIREAVSLFRVRAADSLIVFLLAVVASMIGGMGFYFCVIPGLLTLPYSYVLMGHLFGQVYREAVRGRTSAA